MPVIINTIRYLPFFASAVLFAFFFGSYIWKRKISLRVLKLGTIAVISLVFFRSAFVSVFQYYSWSQGDGISKYFLPPYQSIGYFLGYIWQHYWFNFVIVLSSSLLLASFFYVANDYFKQRKGTVVFQKEEFWFMIFGAFFVMWPGFLLFVILGFLFTAIEKLILAFVGGKTDNIGCYFPFLISMLIVMADVLFWGSYLVKLFNLDVFHV